MPGSPYPLDSDIDREALDAALRDLAPDSDDYARGVLDVLRLFGLVERTARGSVTPSDDVAGMFLSSLRAHLADGVRLGLRWGDLDAGGLRGADILRAAELVRLRTVEEPTPGRVVRVVQAVIKGQRTDGEAVYLMQYDRHAGRYQAIGGKQDHGDADAEAALRREIYEELALPAIPGPDVLALERIGPLWQTRELSATYGILTAYEMAFFAATRLDLPIMPDDDTRWLTRAEIERGRADDGRAISPAYQDGLDGWELIDTLPLVVKV